MSHSYKGDSVIVQRVDAILQIPFTPFALPSGYNALRCTLTNTADWVKICSLDTAILSGMLSLKHVAPPNSDSSPPKAHRRRRCRSDIDIR